MTQEYQVAKAWEEWERKQSGDWYDVTHSDSFYAGYQASGEKSDAVEAQAVDHYEYQAKQDAATIATLKAILELTESELKMLYKKTGVSGEHILRMIEGVMKEQLRSGLVKALEERSRLDPHAPDAIVIPSKTREEVVK